MRKPDKYRMGGSDRLRECAGGKGGAEPFIVIGDTFLEILRAWF